MSKMDLRQRRVNEQECKAKKIVNVADTIVVCNIEKERMYRKALALLPSAYNWSDKDPKYLNMLQELGAKVHARFGCVVRFESGVYWRDCPVDLARIPLGLSIGGQATKVCSICGRDPLDCTHIAGEPYDNVQRWGMGWCNICGKDSCSHEKGEFFDDVVACRSVTRLELEEVSIVDNPADPDACITAVAITKADILEFVTALPLNFVWGMELNCHLCARL